MTDVVRYKPRSGELLWPRSAAERAVARDGRLMQQIITEKTLAASGCRAGPHAGADDPERHQGNPRGHDRGYGPDN